MFDKIQFDSVGEFFQMGNYTFHVWSVYALFVVFIVANLLLPRLQRRQFIREQKRRALRDAQAGSSAVESGRTDVPGGSV
jgi:heme exporter protein D